MEALALQQEKSLEDERGKSFLELQSQRERLRNEVDRNTVKFQTMGKNHPDDLKNPRVYILSQEITKIIHSIQKIDKEMETRISEKKDSLFVRIKEHRHGQRALKGYGGHPSKKAKYISRMG